jgi:hypothetical protein
LNLGYSIESFFTLSAEIELGFSKGSKFVEERGISAAKLTVAPKASNNAGWVSFFIKFI